MFRRKACLLKKKVALCPIFAVVLEVNPWHMQKEVRLEGSMLSCVGSSIAVIVAGIFG